MLVQRVEKRIDCDSNHVGDAQLVAAMQISDRLVGVAKSEINLGKVYGDISARVARSFISSRILRASSVRPARAKATAVPATPAACPCPRRTDASRLAIAASKRPRLSCDMPAK